MVVRSGLHTCLKINIINLCDKYIGESLHVKVCKLILGVHRKTTNHAVRGELGSFPILLTLLRLSVKYWWHLNDLCMKNTDMLVVDALVENRKGSTNYFTWSGGIKNTLYVLDRSDIWTKPNICTGSSIPTVVSNGLENIYSKLWYNCITNAQPKLRTYCRFKTNFILENYVRMFNLSTRVAFSKLRISAHTLMIEKGRHTYPKIPINDRLCKFCELLEIEDEYHFVMSCPLYKSQRDTLLNSLCATFDINSLSNDDIFKMIMSANDYDTLKIVTCFVNSSFKTRSISTTI